MNLRLGTRGSHLARTQAATVAAALHAQGHTAELVIIRTAGDASSAPSFASIGTQGVFVRELEQALIDGRVDVAVHSCKDLPSSSPAALTIAAVPTRADAADVLIAHRSAARENGETIPLAPGSVVGTSSARRQSWIRHLRPDLKVEPLRGNVPTRIAKLERGYDAILLAAAGLDRLEQSLLEDKPDIELGAYTLSRLDPLAFVPAPAQGALALQCRAEDEAVLEALRPLDDAVSHACIDAERVMLERVEGGCDLALGAYCAPAGESYAFGAMLERGGAVLGEAADGGEPAALGARVWEALEAR